MQLEYSNVSLHCMGRNSIALLYERSVYVYPYR